MRAARLHTIGGTLQLDELPDPQPGPGEQIVDIAYASVNPLDVWITQGSPGAAAANLPWTPGTEASGHADGRPVLVR
ncbi:MAG: Alcohol dehydrogenase GroES-like domain, partial [Ilumatobacteraceae bacterium]